MKFTQKYLLKTDFTEEKINIYMGERPANKILCKYVPCFAPHRKMLSFIQCKYMQEWL